MTGEKKSLVYLASASSKWVPDVDPVNAIYPLQTLEGNIDCEN